MCNHDYIVKDFSSTDNSYKIALCRHCFEIKNVIPRKSDEKSTEQSVWDKKDLRITRMSVLKAAVDLSISAQDYTLDNVKELAESMEKWVYRQ